MYTWRSVMVIVGVRGASQFHVSPDLMTEETPKMALLRSWCIERFSDRVMGTVITTTAEKTAAEPQ